ncbi:MAG: cation transporter dimerization domain-containing protein, partial [Nanoarchaeota archaeon]|nr:cation transporter dimerization domain-containing protein [Nanoarchaeota archaeon]
FISLLIAKSGYAICRENIDFLMGKVADQEIIDCIEKKLQAIKEIKSINKIKSQYLGTVIQVEVHIGLDKKLTLEKAHRISHNVQENIEKINLVEHCFVHLEDY